MKIAFSTLGCPDWSWEEIYSTAKDLGFDGVEVRGMGNEMYAPKIKPFTSGNIAATRAKLAKIGLEIPMLTCAAHLACAGSEEQAQIDEIKAYIDLAAALGTPYVRVMGSESPAPDRKIDIVKTAQRYSTVCEYGAAAGVTPLIETNGELADSARMSKLLMLTSSDNKGVLWDIHHPYRFYGEKPEQTIAALGSNIKYLHIKDSTVKEGSVEYRMMGYGDVPVLDTLRALSGRGYEGWVSLEWVKRWNPDLEEPGIVFSHFKNYMSYLLKEI